MSENIYKSPDSELQSDGQATVPMTIKDILFSFQGRIGRGKFWAVYLATIVVTYTLMFAVGLLLPDPAIFGALTFILMVPMIWISLAIQVKRWHDRNKSGWWVCIAFVPIIGAFWALIENGFLAGDEGINNFGAPAAK
ncbi:DUF805 domain-containing protein [Aurantivibrio plasticivorans]